MKKLISITCIVFLLGFSLPANMYAGESDQQQKEEQKQEKAAPKAEWDYLIIGSSSIIVIITLVLSLKYLIKPGENKPDHIKNIVIDNY